MGTLQTVLESVWRYVPPSMDQIAVQYSVRTTEGLFPGLGVRSLQTSGTLSPETPRIYAPLSREGRHFR